jgi:predicted RNase H-like nuclease (RuvC/YqgF family)
VTSYTHTQLTKARTYLAQQISAFKHEQVQKKGTEKLKAENQKLKEKVKRQTEISEELARQLNELRNNSLFELNGMLANSSDVGGIDDDIDDCS